MLWALLLWGIVFLALLPAGAAKAQADSVEYGFIRDDSDPSLLIAVAFPNADFLNNTFTLDQGALFSFYLPAGTIDGASPNDVISDLIFTSLNGATWTVEVFTATWMETFGLDTGNRDLYRFSLASPLEGKIALDPYHLFSFALPAGCDGGSAQVLTNGDAFSSALFAAEGISIENFFSVSAGSDIYTGNDSDGDAIACEEDITLAVSLGYFHASAQASGSVFHWEMATETGNAGFNLLAEDGESLIQVNPALIPSTVVDSLSPTSYQVNAATAATVFYLETIGVDGTGVRHGPFVRGQPYGVRTTTSTLGQASAIYLPMISR